jgi:serine/threonine protein kinase/roadblock/LC7 domain-containing protein
MTLSAGTRLGPYEILAPLGAGGMGEVYRARDTRLERMVAVKVLPSHMASSPEVRQRFEREAKTISQLSHPHICALHDVGNQDGTEYLVMELLEGETLSDRLAKGALPLEQTLRYGIEIADALDKAHRQGIVHRDLKPGNVMITKSGVKLLDFGLAKAMAPAAQLTPLTSLPTAMGGANLTHQGTILGTFQYMAPEQLEGKEADARTDIFALGAVLYEMATGRKAFSGATQASLIGAILHTEPAPISTVQSMSPPALDRVVKTCLAKDPEDRWQSAHDVAGELKWIAEGSQAGVPAPVTARRRNRERLAWGTTTLLLLALVAAVATSIRYAHRAVVLSRPMRLSIVLPEKSNLRAVALSPDGRRLVFVARDSTGRNLLWIRSLESPAVQSLPDTENPSLPFWSPDSRFLGFFADGKLKKIDAAGGPPQTLCDAPVSRGGSWSREGVILFAPVANGPLYRVSASGGLATSVTRFDPSRGEDSHRWPFFLPDGRHFLYTVTSFASGGQKQKIGIYAGSLDSKEETLLLRANSSVAYAPPGYLLFFREGSLLAQPFDAKGLRITGDPTPVAEQIQYFPQTYQVLFSVSENGLLLYQPRSNSTGSRLLWLDQNGKEIGSLGAPGNQANPRISPDGKRVALDITDPKTGNTDIWIYESSRGVATRFTFDPSEETNPVWSPDASRIVFESDARQFSDLYQKDSSGAGSQEILLKSDGGMVPADWSRDGRLILYRERDAKTYEFSLKVLPLTGDGKPMPVINTKSERTAGQFSPDGRWLAYSSNESGKREIVVTPFPGPGGKWQVSVAGGSEPRWRRDGRELFYLAPDGKLMAVEVKQGPTFEAGEAKPLFQTRTREHVSSNDVFSYDVSADGQRFLVNTDVGEVISSPLTVVVNWTAELRK